MIADSLASECSSRCFLHEWRWAAGHDPASHHLHGLLRRGAFQTEARGALLNRLPSVLEQREFPTWDWKEYNKAFTCVRTLHHLTAVSSA